MYPTHRQVPLLLECMQGQGLASLRKLLGVLKDTGHSYLADTLLDTEAIPISDVRPETTPNKVIGEISFTIITSISNVV